MARPNSSGVAFFLTRTSFALDFLKSSFPLILCPTGADRVAGGTGATFSVGSRRRAVFGFTGVAFRDQRRHIFVDLGFHPAHGARSDSHRPPFVSSDELKRVIY